MNCMRWVKVCVVIVAGFLFVGAAWGQTTGEIRGEVKDTTGATIPGAAVTATMEGTGAARTVTTGQEGDFDIPELPVGTYVVTTEATGFKKFVAKDVVVSIGHVALVNALLQVGGKTDTVTVEADAVQVETTSTQLGAVMTDQSISELPLSTRNTYQLLQLQPGVQSQLGADLFVGSSNPGVVSVNGGRGRSNNYMVNGGDGNDIFVNGPAIQPSPDAIEEFRVITNTFDAEYGRNSGSVVNVVTKSGSNAVHGDFYEFLRNNVLNTRGYFDPTVAKYDQNQFGATLGGPIKKDRTFVFGSYESDRQVQGVSSGTIRLPSAAEAGGDFSSGSTFSTQAGGIDGNFASVLNNRPGCAAALNGGAGAAAGNTYATLFPGNMIPTVCYDPTALALYNLYVKPFGAGQVSFVPHGDDNTDQFTVRFDHKINAAQQFSAYYYFNDDNQLDPFSTFQLEAPGGLLPGFGDVFSTRVQQWNLSHTWTIGSTAINEFHFNYFREGQGKVDHPLNILPNVQTSCGSLIPAANCFADPNNPTAGITTNIPGHTGVPAILVNGGFNIGNNFEGELPQVGNTFQWTDNYTKTVGNHTLKFGGDVRRQRFDQFLYFEINGYFNINAQPNVDQVGFDDAYPNYFLGAVNQYQQGSAQGENDRNSAFYFFGQDSYKLKPNLTLNYGLRWELNTPYYDLGNRLQTFRPGQATTQYPCWLSSSNASALGLAAGDCGQGTTNGNNAGFPLGLVFPGDKGVPRGLTTAYYKSFAPRIGLAWSPGQTEGWLAKLTGGPGQTSVRMGYGIFYNPIEQLVLEQFSAEPPFGGSTLLSNTLFNTPFLSQSGTLNPNPFQGIIHQTPTTPCTVDAGPNNGGPNGCVDWSNFRPLLLFGEFQPHLKSQYSEQYNLTIERQLSKDMLLRVSYVGTEAHHLLATHDINPANAQTCFEIMQIAANDPTGNTTSCGPGLGDQAYFIPSTYGSSGSPVIVPAFTPPSQPFKTSASTCNGLPLPYNAGSGSNCLQAGTQIPAGGITLDGIRPYSSPNCQPYTGVGCPADGVDVFSNIFAEDTIANSNYNALQMSVEKSYSHGLLFQASYTFSKAIDQGASFENELNPLNFNATRGLSLLDAKHRFVFSPVWDIPAPTYTGFKGKAVDGWGASAIITYQTGFPIRLYTEDDSELQSSFDFEDANTPQSTGPVVFTNPKTNGGIYFSSNNISDPALGAFGNLPHALCCGPALSNTDLVISKKTPINERWKTEFRAEFYNAWNHTQLANPDGNFTDGVPQISGGVNSGGTFGLIQKTREGPRVMQFAMKILF